MRAFSKDAASIAKDSNGLIILILSVKSNLAIQRLPLFNVLFPALSLLDTHISLPELPGPSIFHGQEPTGFQKCCVHGNIFVPTHLSMVHIPNLPR